MTAWFSTWPTPTGPDYPREVVNSGKARVATVFRDDALETSA